MTHLKCKSVCVNAYCTTNKIGERGRVPGNYSTRFVDLEGQLICSHIVARFIYAFLGH